MAKKKTDKKGLTLAVKTFIQSLPPMIGRSALSDILLISPSAISNACNRGGLTPTPGKSDIDTTLENNINYIGKKLTPAMIRAYRKKHPVEGQEETPGKEHKKSIPVLSEEQLNQLNQLEPKTITLDFLLRAGFSLQNANEVIKFFRAQSSLRLQDIEEDKKTLEYGILRGEYVEKEGLVDTVFAYLSALNHGILNIADHHYDNFHHKVIVKKDGFTRYEFTELFKEPLEELIATAKDGIKEELEREKKRLLKSEHDKEDQEEKKENEDV